MPKARAAPWLGLALDLHTLVWTRRVEVKAKGLAGDDRWFYIEDCMNKT